MMRNRGTVAVLAMIFLAIFVVLGLSFFTMATTSSSTAGNDRDGQRAAAAADSGVALLHNQIGSILIAKTSATGEKAMKKFGEQLKKLNGHATMINMGAPANGQVTVLPVPQPDNPRRIIIPPMKLHADSEQYVAAEICFLDDALATALYTPMRMEVTGYDRNPTKAGVVSRKVKMDLVAYDRSMELWNYGVFSKGRVDLADGKACIIGEPPEAGNLGSAYTGDIAVYLHGGQVTGEIAVSGDPAALFLSSSTAGSIAGEDIMDDATLQEALEHVREIQAPPVGPFNPNQYYRSDLPVIDDQKDVQDISDHVVKDVCLQPPAGQDKVTITIGGGDVLDGLIYVKKGVTLDIQGGAVIRGTIVVEDPNLDENFEPTPGLNETSTSSLIFHGTPTFQPSETWPSPSPVPPDQQAQLREYSVLAPTAYLYIQGSGGGKDGETTEDHSHLGFAKTVVVGTLEENGSGIVNILDGTLVTMSDTLVTGTKGFSSYLDGDGIRIVHSEGWTPPYSGYIHLYSWVVDQKTYQEVAK